MRRVDVPSGSVRVLVVEDNEDDVVLLQRAFEKTPHIGAHYVGGVGPARERLKDGLRPDAVLVDVHLPDGNGLEFVEALRQDPSMSGVPVVVYSGDPDAALQEEAARRGADRFVSKPFSASGFDVLAAVISELGGRR